MGDLATLSSVKRWLGLTDKAISGITRANPGVVTCASHNLSTGDQVIISNVSGMTEVNGNTYTVTVLTSDTFSIGVNTSAYTTYVSGGTFNAEDVVLARLISSESAFIEAYLGRNVLSMSRTYVFDGNGGYRAILPAFPITAVSSVAIDGTAIPATTTDKISGYMFDENFGIYLVGYAFTPGIRNCTIGYTAGYATVPNDIEQACIELVTLRYAERDRPGLQSKSLAGENVAYDRRAMSDNIRAVLDGYKKVVPL